MTEVPQELLTLSIPMENSAETSGSQMEIPEIDDDFSYDGYQVVRGEFFAHIYEPSITFNASKVSVNTACVRKLPDVQYVQILVNPETKKLAIRPCEEEEKDSFAWSSGASEKKKKPKQITCKVFFAKIMQLMDWNPDFRYKLLGKLISSGGELLYVFDLKTPEIFKKVYKDGVKPKASRIATYPAEWQNQFGLSVEEHRKQLQINIVKGFAVFDVREREADSLKQEETPSSEQPVEEVPDHV